MLSGEELSSYLVYTTGRGFPPPIEGVPQALKGIATVFMLAMLTGIDCNIIKMIVFKTTHCEMHISLAMSAHSIY